MRYAALCLAALLCCSAGRVGAQEERADCVSCHEEIGHLLARGAHDGLDCVDCHADGAGFDPEEGWHVAPAEPPECILCHDPPDRTSGHPELSRDVACTVCHGSHLDPTREPALAAPRCLACHREDPDRAGMGLPREAVESVHGRAGLGCALCHRIPGDVAAGERPCQETPPLDCGACHPRTRAAWAGSIHARAREDGSGPAAGCQDCHGGHRIRVLRAPEEVPQACERCHGDGVDLPSGNGAPPMGASYEASVHGVGLRIAGLVVVPTCSSCHGSHDILPRHVAGSRVSRASVPYTCGECHAGILRRFLEGVHGQAFLADVTEAPVCTDCHGEHAFQGPGGPDSPVAPRRVAGTCARCHADDRLASAFGLPAGVLRSWRRSYHGIASTLGEKRAANCASCHGWHAVLPAKDPRSRIHPSHLAATCGGCHPGAGSAFSRVPVHSLLDPESNPIPWLVRDVYLWLIRVLISLFLLFIAIDLLGRLRRRLGWGPPALPPVDPAEWPDEDELAPPDERFPRLSRLFRVQHGLLVAAFTLLVLTGLPLFLHDLPWLRGVLSVEGSYHLRSYLHRLGAWALIGLSAWHLVLVVRPRRAWPWLRSIWIRPRDIRDFLRRAAHDLGLAPPPPWPDRYTLVEKLEYWAVVWGNTVMIASGVVLWRPEWFLDRLPPWTFDLCRVLHGYEATLAFLAILVWHMYHVHVRPDVFPMNRSWIHGRIGRQEMREHHTGEYLRILSRRRAARASLRGQEPGQEVHQEDGSGSASQP